MSSDPKVLIAPTPREFELMMLIARGMQNKNIAHALKISENTVRAHIGNVMRKYHLHNRTQIAIIFALETATPALRHAMSIAAAYSESIGPTSMPAWKTPHASPSKKRASRT
jgi:DNA-binding CsgD family transcriptional regulator